MSPRRHHTIHPSNSKWKSQFSSYPPNTHQGSSNTQAFALELVSNLLASYKRLTHSPITDSTDLQCQTHTRKSLRQGRDTGYSTCSCDGGKYSEHSPNIISVIFKNTRLFCIKVLHRRLSDLSKLISQASKLTYS